MSWIGESQSGIPYMVDDGLPKILAPGANSYILSINNSVPVWVPISSGNINTTIKFDWMGW